MEQAADALHDGTGAATASPELLDAVRLAAEPDAYVVAKLVVDARATVGDNAIVTEAALVPLCHLAASAARGALPRREWPRSIQGAFDQTAAQTGAEQPARTIGALIGLLRAALAADAHEERIRTCLGDVRRACLPMATRAPLMVQLLRGAALASSLPPPSPLQEQLLAEVSACAVPPLGVDGLLQAPFRDAQTARDAAAVALARQEQATTLGAPVDVVLAAAELARRGEQRGAKHGCLLIASDACGADAARSDGEHADASWRVVGHGWNHEVHEERGAKRRKRVLHAECHAIADAIGRWGEEQAFAAFEHATAWIVELRDEVAYDDAPPCRKCACLLRAVGVTRVAHTTRGGALQRLELPPQRPELLRVPMASLPLAYACDAAGVHCERLERALSHTEQRVDEDVDAVSRDDDPLGLG